VGDIVRFSGRPGIEANRLQQAHDLVADVEVSLRRPGETWSGLWLLVRTAVIRIAHYIGSEQAASRLEIYAAELRASKVRGVLPESAPTDPTGAA
jgi:hypothetical protein